MSVTIGQRIAQRRGTLGLSQSALANRITEAGFTVDASAISRIESDQRDLRLSEVSIIAKALGAEPEEIAYGIAIDMDARWSGYQQGWADANSAIATAIKELGTP